MNGSVHTFSCRLVWTDKLAGRTESDSRPPISVGAPPEFGGTGDVWSPEHLTAAAVNACIMLTFLAIAGNSKMAIRGYESDATAILEKTESRGTVITRVNVRPRITVPAGTDTGRVERVLRMAERNCFVSNSLAAAVTVEAEISTIE